MSTKSSSTFTLLTLIMAGIVLLTMLAWPQPVGATLPPRPPSTPVAPPAEEDEGKEQQHVTPGAYIELMVQPGQTGFWSTVQWQDNAGNWHAVEGWQGSLEASQPQRWWVAAKDFGTGPFRWVVSAGPDHPVLASSAPFHLPTTANEVMQVEASLRP